MLGPMGKMQSSKITGQQQRLEKEYSSYLKRQAFEVGQIVQWKPGLKNSRRPLYDQPLVVLEVLDSPIRDTKVATGSPYYREPLDIVLGLIDEDGDFLAFHFDSNRFELFSGAHN